MRFSKKTIQSNRLFPSNPSQKLRRALGGVLLAAGLGTLLSACGGGSSDDEATGYFKFYNASANSPSIYLSLDDTDYPGVNFSQSSSMYEVDNSSFDLSLAWKEGSDDYNTFIEQEVNFDNGQVDLMMLVGDINNPEFVTYQFKEEDPDTEDEQFTFRFINMHNLASANDVYLAKNDQTFNEATLLGSYSYQEMSDSLYADLDTYKLYLTEAGSTEVLYESNDITFSNTSQYVMVIKANSGPSNSNYAIDKLNKSSGVVEYPDKESRAQVRFYNGLTQHQLLPAFDNSIDIDVSGINGDEYIDALAKGQFSEAHEVSFGDYAIDVSASGDETPFAENFFLSLSANNDKTVFVYHTVEEEEDDGDSSTEEEINLYVNTLSVENSSRVSLYDHQINIINLVDDYSVLELYFARSNETVSTADYSVTSSRALPRVVTLPNNTFDVSIIVRENQSELLLSFEQLTLSADSGDMYMIIEEDANSSSGYSVKMVAQNVQ
ncbi:MAG: hypothetical protein ACI8WB_005074 [Phenylobacterium sp.]|jgi:hypothetical protein